MDKKEIKKTIRKEIAHLKKNHTMEWQEKMSALILSKLEETDQFRNARSIAIYHAIPGEVQTESFINKWHKTKQLYLPVIENDFLKLQPYHGPDNLKAGVFGILEPASNHAVDVSDISLIIVPGVAFDKNRNRMGRGKGYYDKLLKHSQACKIGICYEFQLIEEVPSESFDVPMDVVITESEVI